MFRLLCALLALASAAVAAPKPATPSAAPRFKSGLGAAELREPENGAVSSAAQVLAKRGIAAFARGDLAAARADFEAVLELAPTNAATLINLALIEHRERNFAAAERLLDRALRAQPGAGLAWLLLGVVRHDQGRLDAALAALAQAVFLEPKDARAHHYLGVTIGRKGWYLGAEDEMRKAIELEPDYADAHFNLAVFYLQRTPPAIELARRHYQKARDLGAAPDAEIDRKLAASE